MCPQFRGVAVTSHIHNVVALREILETLNPALKLGRGNGGFRERGNLVLESQKPTNELQAAKEGLSGVRPPRGSAASVLQSPYQGNLIE